MSKTKKKSNIAFELAKLQSYVDSLQKYLDQNGPDHIQQNGDREITKYNSQTGQPVIKIVASKETQLKAYRDTLQNLPKLYDDLYRLRLLAENEGLEVTQKARGDKDIPGLFRNKMIDKPKEEVPQQEKDYDLSEEEDQQQFEDSEEDDDVDFDRDPGTITDISWEQEEDD